MSHLFVYNYGQYSIGCWSSLRGQNMCIQMMRCATNTECVYVQSPSSNPYQSYWSMWVIPPALQSVILTLESLQKNVDVLVLDPNQSPKY